jgi:hypothetical protein
VKIATPRKNDPSKFKLCTCVDQCTTTLTINYIFRERKRERDSHRQRDRVRDDIHVGSTAMSLVSTARSVSSELQNEV